MLTWSLLKVKRHIFNFLSQVLAEHPDVDKVAFTGSTDIGKILRRVTVYVNNIFIYIYIYIVGG